jgi:hypothetical protein
VCPRTFPPLSLTDASCFPCACSLGQGCLQLSLFEQGLGAAETSSPCLAHEHTPEWVKWTTHIRAVVSTHITTTHWSKTKAKTPTHTRNPLLEQPRRGQRQIPGGPVWLLTPQHPDSLSLSHTDHEPSRILG